jgi:hypothetical protein
MSWQARALSAIADHAIVRSPHIGSRFLPARQIRDATMMQSQAGS